MSYHRLDVNLLPPEMQPSPVVRFILPINLTIIAIGLLAILGHVAFSWFLLKGAVDDRDQLKADIAGKQQIVSDHNVLTNAKSSIDRFGRVTALISREYLDVPVLLDRLSMLLPRGVYLERISNDGMNVSPTETEESSTTVQMTFRASELDPWLLVQSLTMLKQDELFNDCYLVSVSTEDADITEVLREAGVNWEVDGPGITPLQSVTEYTFDVRARIKAPLALPERPLLADYSELVHDFFASDPGAPAGESGEALDSANAPAGVEVEGVN